MKNLIVVLLFLLALIPFSCNEKEDSTVVGDAIVVARKAGPQTEYGIAYYAYAYSPLKSVTVFATIDQTRMASLVANGNYTTNFVKEPADEDFSSTKPLADHFVFKAVFESGRTYETEDDISSDILGLPVIETCTFNTTKKYAEISWTALENADSYAISVFDSSNSIVFRSNEFANTITNFQLKDISPGWSTGFPASKATYNVRIQAFKYEDSKNPNQYHIQSTSYSEAKIVWN